MLRVWVYTWISERFIWRSGVLIRSLFVYLLLCSNFASLLLLPCSASSSSFALPPPPPFLRLLFLWTSSSSLILPSQFWISVGNENTPVSGTIFDLQSAAVSVQIDMGRSLLCFRHVQDYHSRVCQFQDYRNGSRWEGSSRGIFRRTWNVILHMAERQPSRYWRVQMSQDQWVVLSLMRAIGQKAKIECRQWLHNCMGQISHIASFSTLLHSILA